MNIIIYGAGRLGKRVLQITKKYNDIKVIGFADTFQQGTCEGYPILDVCGEASKYSSIPIIIAVGGFVETRKMIYYRLKSVGLHLIYYFWNKTYCAGNDFLRDECISLELNSDNVLFYAEMSVVDYCNLNCKGCNHYAAIFPQELPNIETRLRDVKQLATIYDKVVEFGLIGGEPFLNPDIVSYIEGIRTLLPDTHLQIVSNGLLVLQVSAKILHYLHENNVLLVISEYPPTSIVIDDITKRLKDYGVDYEIRPVENKQKFYKTLSITENSIYPKKCISAGCINVCDGRIARCPTLLYIEKLNQKFATKFPNDGIYNLNDYTDGKNLNSDLMQRVPLCNFCIDYLFDWAPCGANVTLDDFVVRK